MNILKNKKICSLAALLMALVIMTSSIAGILSEFTYSFAVTDENYSSEINSYYSSIDESLTGKEFREQLAKLITDTHTHETTYSELGSIYKTSDADIDNAGNIIWFYSGTSVPYSGIGGSVGDTNREHVWPKDNGKAFPASSKAGSDAHHLRPTECGLNSARGNKNFDEVPMISSNIVSENGSVSYDNLCYSDGTFFYPGEGYRGATARILMYVQVRWGNDYNLRFVDSEGNSKTIGKISTLLKWHLEEPPTEEEILRNEAVYAIQGNRNPFIDHPEYATKIYCYDGESYNSTLLKVAEQYGDYGSDEIDSITFSSTSLDMVVGQTSTLGVHLTPTNAPISLLEWTSSDDTIATVSAGKVTAKENGVATITASSKLDNSISSSIKVRVKSIIDIKVTGSLIKKIYNAGEKLDPTGLAVRITYSDNTTSTISNDSCLWLDGSTHAEILSPQTTSVICKYGDFEIRIDGIKVNEAKGGSFTINRTSFNAQSSYAWQTWNSDSFSGKGFMYGGNNSSIQMNSNKTAKYIFNSTPIKGGIISITVKTVDTAKNWELLTSSTPFNEGSGVPSSGTSHGVKSVTSSGVTWTVNSSDEYFSLNYSDSGAVYLDSITVTYGYTTSGCNHSFGEWIQKVEPTCSTPGIVAHYECQNCGDLFDSEYNPIDKSVIEQISHTESEWIIDIAPQPNEDGLCHKECTICGELISKEVIPYNSNETDSGNESESLTEHVSETQTDIQSETESVTEYVTETISETESDSLTDSQDESNNEESETPEHITKTGCKATASVTISISLLSSAFIFLLDNKKRK